MTVKNAKNVQVLDLNGISSRRGTTAGATGLALLTSNIDILVSILSNEQWTGNIIDEVKFSLVVINILLQVNFSFIISL